MRLRPLKHSQQHDLLLDLEQQGNDVYYAAPEFHLPDELNKAYLDGAGDLFGSDAVRQSAPILRRHDMRSFMSLTVHGTVYSLRQNWTTLAQCVYAACLRR